MSATLFATVLALAAPAHLPWHALPDGGGPDGRLEIAWLAKDVRTVCAAGERLRRVMAEVPPGRALLEAVGSVQRPPCAAMLAMLTPQGSVTPAVVALLHADERFGLVSAVKVDSGFLERMRRAPPPGWQFEEAGPLFSLSREKLRWVGRVDADGWLRLSDDARWLGYAPRNDTWVSEAMATRLESSDMALVLAGDGVVARRIAGNIPGPALANLAAGTRHMALAWQTDGAKTALLRVLAEADFLRAWPKAEPQGSVAAEVEAGAQGFAALQLPPDWPELLPMLLQNTAALREAPDTFVEALRTLRGRVAWVDFGVPGDGALLAKCDTAEHAQGMVPALRDWAGNHGATLLTGPARNFAMETVPGASGPALHLQPERGISGPWLASRDARVFFVQQRARLAEVLGAQRTRHALLDGPLTPLMRRTLALPRPFQSYWVLGGNGAWLDYLVWGAGHAGMAREPHVALAPVKRFLPQIFAVASYLWQRTYDVAATADVSDSVLEIQLAHSEI